MAVDVYHCVVHISPLWGFLGHLSYPFFLVTYWYRLASIITHHQLSVMRFKTIKHFQIHDDYQS
jgi:hypothetical protein